MTKSAPDTPWTDEEIAAHDRLNEIVLRENEGIQRALADVRAQGVTQDVAVVVIDENGTTTIFALPRANAREMTLQFPVCPDVPDRLAVPAGPGKLWAAVYSVSGTRVAGVAMQLVRVRAPKA